MNYISELNAFYDWLETNTLSANAVLTWQALMHTNNKCFWKKEFAVAISVLSLKTGGVSRRSIERARNELQQKGLIIWRKRAGCSSATYTMIPFVRQTDALCDAQNEIVRHTDAQHVAQPDVQPDVQNGFVRHTDAQPDAINKRNIIKTNTKTKHGSKPSGGSRGENEKELLRLLDERELPLSLHQCVKEWLQYKAERKETYKPTGFTKFLSICENHSSLHGEVAVVSAIENSMANGWKGVVWERLSQSHQGQSTGNQASGNVFADMAREMRENGGSL